MFLNSNKESEYIPDISVHLKHIVTSEHYRENEAWTFYTKLLLSVLFSALSTTHFSPHTAHGSLIFIKQTPSAH